MNNLTYLIPHQTYIKLKTANSEYLKVTAEYNSWMQSLGFGEMVYADFIKKYNALPDTDKQKIMEDELQYKKRLAGLNKFILDEVNNYVSNN